MEDFHEKELQLLDKNNFISRTTLVFANGQLSLTLGRYSQHVDIAVGHLGRNGGVSIEKLVIVYIILALFNNGSFRSHNTEKRFDH